MQQTRWDAVVEDAGFWSCAPRGVRAAEGGAPLRADVHLFGALADGRCARHFLVEMPQGGSVHDIVQEIAKRAGDTFAARALDAGGALNRCCRVFVDGQAVDDARARIRAAGAPARIELILLTAAEGG